jgi:HemY protein
LVAEYDRLAGETQVPDRLKRLERLIARHPGEATGHLSASAVALEARLWGEARRHLDAAGARSNGPWPAELCRLMADLEERELEDPAAAALWRARLGQATAGPEWLCASCEMSADAWRPICQHCGAFDAIEWSIPSSASTYRAKLPHPGVRGVALPMLELLSPDDGVHPVGGVANSGATAEIAAREAGV